MTRYAAIDRHSGYVWGDAVAEDALTAAAAIMRASDHSVDWRVEECSQTDAEASLDLYGVSADLVIEDGQRQETIDAVAAGRYAGTVRTYDASEDDDVQVEW